MIRTVTTILCLFCLLPILPAQEEQSTSIFTPTIQFDGMLKTKFEYAEKTNASRFSIRNSSMGITGDITPFASYRAQVELSNEGKFTVLDLYGAILLFDGFSLKLGQQSIPVNNPYITSPGRLLFANRAFIGKYFTPGTRDIGISATYDFLANNIPIGIDAALFNGNVINDPEWTQTPSYSARLRFGNMKGLRSTAKMYKYPKSEELNFVIYGWDLRYEAANWKVETEVMHRSNKPDNHKLTSTYLQGAYWFPLPPTTKLFKNMIVATRWDAIGSNQTAKDIDLNRLTMGLGFSFTRAPFESLIRIDYEHYLSKTDLPLWNRTPEETSNKLTLELLFNF